MVKREPEWDDDERETMLALALYERGVCSCGFHQSLTRDKANVFTFEEVVCSVCAGVSRYSRIQGDADDKALKAIGDNASPGSARPGDGRRTFTKIVPEVKV